MDLRPWNLLSSLSLSLFFRSFPDPIDEARFLLGSHICTSDFYFCQSFSVEDTSHEDRFCVVLSLPYPWHPAQCLAGSVCSGRICWKKKKKNMSFPVVKFFDISSSYLTDPINSWITIIFNKLVSPFSNKPAYFQSADIWNFSWQRVVSRVGCVWKVNCMKWLSPPVPLWACSLSRWTKALQLEVFIGTIFMKTS